MSQHTDFEKALLHDPSRDALLIWSDLLEESGMENESVRLFAQYTYRPFAIEGQGAYVCWTYGFNHATGFRQNLPTALFSKMAGRKTSKRIVWGVPFTVERKKRRSAASLHSGRAIFKCEPDTVAHANAAAIYAAAVAMLAMHKRAEERRAQENAELLEAI
jgi:hypothetical protein